MVKIRLVRFVPIFITLLVLVPVGTALAHSPVFPGENHSPATAYHIDDPVKSWAIYDELDHLDEGEYYEFSVSRGEKIQLALLTPESPAEGGFLPSFALLIPEMTQGDEAPDHIEVPAGYGATIIEGRDPGRATYEGFSPGWFYEVANMTTDAPVDGIYYVVVFGTMQSNDTHANEDDENHDDDHEAARYGLVVGYVESFTPIELIMVQYSVQKVYAWEGQNQFVTLLPIILVLVIGGIILYLRSRKGRAPKDISKWLASLAGLAFLGSGVSIVYQMFLTFSVTGLHGQAMITLIFFVFSVILGVATLRYAVRDKPILTTRRRIGLAITGLIALFVWSGLYLGTALAIAAALVPSHSVGKD
ncbi:MAG: hypothetical protein OEV57_06825 [Dehalococcoidia bacterium]|nr:hypothetical protein [Dehalococcoidia bacterium]